MAQFVGLYATLKIERILQGHFWSVKKYFIFYIVGGFKLQHGFKFLGKLGTFCVDRAPMTAAR